MIVNLGPQSVHVMKGCRYRRSVGSSNSAAHSLHIAVSGATSVRAPAVRVLSTMWNPMVCSVSVLERRTASTCASGGSSPVNLRANSSIAVLGPHTSMKTPAESLPTKPSSPASVAIRCTNGRNPTPWITPTTSKRSETHAVVDVDITGSRP